jgi:hypothetical protein
MTGTDQAAFQAAADGYSTEAAERLRDVGEQLHGIEVTFDKKGNLVLPKVPQLGDIAGLCAWLTVVLSLNRVHPIVRMERLGLSGPRSHVVVARAGLKEPIIFEPATVINTARKLTDALEWQLRDFDGRILPLKDAHCRTIAHVVRMGCGAFKTMTANQETVALIAAYLHQAEMVEGFTTYGTQEERHAAVTALRRDRDKAGILGPYRYLIDSATGEVVITVDDLREVARRFIGGSLQHGWLDARTAGIEWCRRPLQGYRTDNGVRSSHVRIDVYRGLLPREDLNT